MFRGFGRYGGKRFTFPHACGDVPAVLLRYKAENVFSPRLWGCSASLIHSARFLRLFPTPVGMFRAPAASGLTRGTFPHACGDVPYTQTLNQLDDFFSPRLWGCSASGEAPAGTSALFPTPVGMFRLASFFASASSSFPHACGDVPGD